MKKLLIFLLLSLGFNSYAEDVFYCTTELSTGFGMKDGVWETRKYKDDRYTIKFNDDYSTLSGLQTFHHYCEQSRTWDESSPIVCSPLGQMETFIFNKDLKRFIYMSGTYTGYIDNLDFSNHMEAGTCESF
jgi:hypothetical protein